MKTASTEFVVGKHGIRWVGKNFRNNLYDLPIKKGKKLHEKVLEKPMNDAAIIEAWHPKPIELGDFIDALPTLDRTQWYLFHVRATNDVLWAVYARWSSDGLNVEAHPLDSPLDWDAGDRFLSRGFSDALPAETLESFDSLPAVLIINGIHYDKRV